MHVPEAGRAQHFAQAVTHTLVLLVMTLLAACAQSGQVFEPTNNRAVTATTAPTTYTFTLNINITTHGANHQNKPFSALLFRDGTLFAAQYNNGSTAGTDMTSGTGTATLVLNGVDTNGCPTGTPAALEAGTYELYFAVQYAAETPHTLNPVPACGGNGWMQSSMNGAVAGNLYGVKGSVNVTGNTTYNITNTNLVQFRQHTFAFTAGFANYRCNVAILNATSYIEPVQPLAIFTRAGDGSTTGGTATYNLLPVGTYKYFCSGSADGAHFQSGADSQATGTFTVTHTGVTNLNPAAFTLIP
jgi:hypothetical protein